MADHISPCSGAELWGYSTTGERNATAFYRADGVLAAEQNKAWRVVIQQLTPKPRAPEVSHERS